MNIKICFLKSLAYFFCWFYWTNLGGSLSVIGTESHILEKIVSASQCAPVIQISSVLNLLIANRLITINRLNRLIAPSTYQIFKMLSSMLIRGQGWLEQGTYLRFRETILNVKILSFFNWLYVLIMSHMHFRVNPHYVVAWISKNSLLKTGTISEF